MIIHSNIIWITGLPCIGKSTIIPSLIKSNKCVYIESDIIRDNIIKSDPAIYEEYEHLNRFKYDNHKYKNRYKSEKMFLDFHKDLSSFLVDRIIDELDLSSDNSFYIEISPFTLMYSHRKEKSLLFKLSKFKHLSRIKNYTGCSDQDANDLYTFLSNAFNSIQESLYIHKIIDIDEISIDDLQSNN